MKYAALFFLLCLFGCAAEPLKPGKLQVIDFECDASGVHSLRVMIDGPTVSTVSWDNKDVCGDPT